VELYDLSMSRIPMSSLLATASSFNYIQHAASSAIDGNATTYFHSSDQEPRDPTPSLRIFYPCNSGFSELSKVVIKNGHWRSDVWYRITAFTIDFLNARGDAVSSRPFPNGNQFITFWANAEPPPPLPPAPPSRRRSTRGVCNLLN
jgi:hypothetical protein